MAKKDFDHRRSGLLGTSLSQKLDVLGYEVIHLSRYKSKVSKYQIFTWDIANGLIEDGALEGVDYIIHLAGAGVADKRWTDERKKVLASSRIDSAALILDRLKNSGKKIKAFISASAIGIYGFDTGSIVQTEERTQLGDDFLAMLTKKWEHAADQFNSRAGRVVKFRIGLVLSPKGGLLEKLVPVTRFGLASAFGNGEQYMSWIHIDDLVEMFVKAIEDDSLEGIFNAVAPNPVTNKEFLKTLAETLGRPFFLPDTPKFVLKMVLGELASAITGGNNVSPEKIQHVGFQFQHPDLDESLNDLLR
jgi:uncharacterized protein (TIGR01777 family)